MDHTLRHLNLKKCDWNKYLHDFPSSIISILDFMYMHLYSKMLKVLCSRDYI